MSEEQQVIEEEDIDNLPSVITRGNAFEVFNKLTYGRPRVSRIVQLYLTGCYSTAEIADIVDIKKDTVLRWLRRQEVKNYIAEYQAEEMAMLKTKMVGNADRAFQKMVKLLDSNMDNVALQASKDILDRTGFKPQTEIKQEITVKTYEEQLKDLMKNTIDDVEYEVVDDGVE